jgi:hypothetical protein
MTSSGTYNFGPSIGELVLYAYNKAQIRGTALAQEHFESARMAVNLMLARWANQGVNLWKVDLVTVPLVQGTATYAVDPSTVMILDAYVTTTSGSSSTNRIILPISRTEYASYPNPTEQGFTTVFWFDRLISPTITLWQVPNGTSATSMSYYRVRQIQDAAFTAGQTPDIPYRWLEAFADGLAYRLATIWNPSIAALLKAVADESYTIAADQDVEASAVYISPQLAGYYRA